MRFAGLRKLSANYISDETYIKGQYFLKFGKPLNLNAPQTFNEKIQWLKINWHDPLLTVCSDKYAVREYVQERLGSRVLKKLYHVYSSVKEIDFDMLPDSFVLKLNHGSGQNIFCRRKLDLDWDHTVRRLQHYFDNNHYYYGREWCYKNISPLILCEELLNDRDEPQYDYHLLCFDGEPLFIEVMSDKLSGDNYMSMFDAEWNWLDRSHKKLVLFPNIPARPACLEALLEYGRHLSQGFPYARVDFFYSNGHLYFGEITFYPMSGLTEFIPEKYDHLLGSFIRLPQPSPR